MQTSCLTSSQHTPTRLHQTGVALVTALVLLVVITVLGLAAVRSATVQQRLSGNFYDRELAFQAAEAALGAARSKLARTTTPNLAPCAPIPPDTTPLGFPCLVNPFNDPNLPAGTIRTIATGTGVGEFTTSGNAAAKPQYVIQYMGNSTGSPGGPDGSANNDQRGPSPNNPVGDDPGVYRITVRSGDPAIVDNRAIVTLQAIYTQ